MKELQITLSGRVQGVSMRKSVKKMAESFGLVGYVENVPNGTVHIVAQGKEDDLMGFLEWCHRGEFPAQVKGLLCEWRDCGKKFNEFEIRRYSSVIADQAQSMKNLGRTALRKTPANIPTHVAVIADGNRRWARAHGWKPWVGHRKGGDVDRLRGIYAKCKKIGVKYVSMWVWSTENWERSKEEQEAIFSVFMKGFEKAKEICLKDKIRFKHVGRKDRLPKDIVTAMDEMERATKDFSDLSFILCVDYGGRDEIVRAVNKVIADGKKSVTEETFATYLDTHGIPDPDLVIRTSGEMRLSGLMPFQSTYAELYSSPVLLPDFGVEEFMKAVDEYSRRTRRFGGTVTGNDGVDESHLTDPDEE